MNLTTEQVETVVRHLGNGSRIVEAARMALVPYSVLAGDWTTGRSDAEQERDTPEATFYTEAQAARSRHIATARARAQAAAGSRESADLLSYVKALEAEQEPLGDDAERQNAVRLTASDDPDVRDAAMAVGDSCRGLLHALTAKDNRERRPGAREVRTLR